MSQLLYYPYINVPRTDWTIRTLLYYDNIGSIVPQEYFYNPEDNYEAFMLQLIREQLVIPINPIDELEQPWDTARPFLDFLQNDQEKLMLSQRRFLNDIRSRVHADKFDQNIFHNLEELGLAERGDGMWFWVEQNS